MGPRTQDQLTTVEFSGGQVQRRASQSRREQRFPAPETQAVHSVGQVERRAPHTGSERRFPSPELTGEHPAHTRHREVPSRPAPEPEGASDCRAPQGRSAWIGGGTQSPAQQVVSVPSPASTLALAQGLAPAHTRARNAAANGGTSSGEDYRTNHQSSDEPVIGVLWSDWWTKLRGAHLCGRGLAVIPWAWAYPAILLDGGVPQPYTLGHPNGGDAAMAGLYPWQSDVGAASRCEAETGIPEPDLEVEVAGREGRRHIHPTTHRIRRSRRPRRRPGKGFATAMQ